MSLALHLAALPDDFRGLANRAHQLRNELFSMLPCCLDGLDRQLVVASIQRRKCGGKIEGFCLFVVRELMTTPLSNDQGTDAHRQPCAGQSY